MGSKDKDIGLGFLAFLASSAAVGVSVVVDAIPSSVGWGLLIAGSLGVLLAVAWLLSESFRKWEPFYYRFGRIRTLLLSPEIGFHLSTRYNTRTQSRDFILYVFNHGPSKEFKATFRVPDACPRNDRIALNPTENYWWEKAEGVVSLIPTNAEDCFRVSSQRTEHLPESDDPHYPHSQFSLYRYDPDRDQPSHFCHMGYSPNIHDDPPDVIVTVTVAAVYSEPAVSREIRLRVDTGGVDLLD